VGGGFAGGAGNNVNLRNIGTNLMISGIVWQVATLIAFAGLVIDYIIRTRRAWNGVTPEAKSLLKQRKFRGFLAAVVVAFVTVFYFAFCTSISGYSVNPARSFSSALFARTWQGIWIYFLAPSSGMLVAAAIYKSVMRGERIYCAKVFHDLKSVCPFDCRFEQLESSSQSRATSKFSGGRLSKH